MARGYKALSQAGARGSAGCSVGTEWSWSNSSRTVSELQQEPWKWAASTQPIRGMGCAEQQLQRMQCRHSSSGATLLGFGVLYTVSSVTELKFWSYRTMFVDVGRLVSHCSVLMFLAFLVYILTGLCFLFGQALKIEPCLWLLALSMIWNNSGLKIK